MGVGTARCVCRGGWLATAGLFDGSHVLVLGQEARVLYLLGLGHVCLRRVGGRSVVEAPVVHLKLLLLLLLGEDLLLLVAIGLLG